MDTREGGGVAQKRGTRLRRKTGRKVGGVMPKHRTPVSEGFFTQGTDLGRVKHEDRSIPANSTVPERLTATKREKKKLI